MCSLGPLGLLVLDRYDLGFNARVFKRLEKNIKPKQSEFYEK